jgi:hypothetical protein
MTMLMASNRAESEKYNDAKFVRIALVENEKMIMKIGRILD